MPTYEYVCSKCDHQFEKFQPITEAPLAVCPQELCPGKRWGKGRLKRVIGAGAGLIFKGSGFHITDYRSESYKEAARKESSSPVPPAGGDGKPAAKAKAEAKTETKTGSKAPKPKRDNE